MQGAGHLQAVDAHIGSLYPGPPEQVPGSDRLHFLKAFAQYNIHHIRHSSKHIRTNRSIS